MSEKEYIERGDAINIITMGISNAMSSERAIAYSDITRRINAIPSADVEPVVRGEWKPDDRMFGVWHCSVCGESALCNGVEEEVKSAFCPHCGAKMNES